MKRDAFGVLGVERRPLPDAEAIRAAFVHLAKSLHPDAAGGDALRFQELREARDCLLDPGNRLLLLSGEVPNGKSLPATSQGWRFFEKIARDGFQDRGLISELRAWRDSLDSTLRELDAQWPEVSNRHLGELAIEYRFCTKWLRQAREAFAAG